MNRGEAKRVVTASAALNALANERDPLRRLDLVRRVLEAAEQLERINIDAARALGQTWLEIGEVYGMTKQGAQQRFRRSSPPSASRREKKKGIVK